jgi:hypothetical protein
MTTRSVPRRFSVLGVAVLLTLAAAAASTALGDCGPFTDVSAFCGPILELYYVGITSGTSATTFDPNATVNRTQMALFLTRSFDQTLARSSRRAALAQWWTQTPFYDQGLGVTSLSGSGLTCRGDGQDIWVTANTTGSATVERVRASDGTHLQTWTLDGNVGPWGVLPAMGRVFVVQRTSPGRLYMINPFQPQGTVSPVTSQLGNGSIGIAFDGSRIWTTNIGGNVSIVTPGTWQVNNVNVSTGTSVPVGILFDGANIWVTDIGDNTLKKLNANGTVALSVHVGVAPYFSAFDGRNIWVPNVVSDSLTVVRASDGAVLKTFSAADGNQNGLNGPQEAAFDGQRILVVNSLDSVSLFKAADLSIIGNYPTPGASSLYGACSDGINFWVVAFSSGKLLRF